MNDSHNLKWSFALWPLMLGLVVAAPQPARSQCDPPPAGIVGWWPGNGSTADLLGVDNGTAEGPLAYGPGEVGQAFSFDGSSGYVLVPAAQVLNVGTGGGLTIETWINPGDVSNERPLVEWNNGSSSGYGVHFWISVPAAGGGVGSLYANLMDVSGNNHNFSSALGMVITNVFQHVALTYNQSTGIGTLYYNGAPVATQNLGVFTPQTTYNLCLGYRPGFAPTAVPMLEGDVSIYNRALAATEIQAIYAAGTAGKCPNELPPVVGQSPASATATFGGKAGFSAVVAGSAPFSYQWVFNGTNLPGATNVTLNLTNLTLTQIGSYALSVSNRYGQVLSSSAFLAETGYPGSVAPPAGLANWWPGEGNGVDVAGGNNGALVGGVTITNGEVGQAFNFDGASGYVDLGAWNPGGTWTLEAWVNPASLPGGRHAIVSDFYSCEDWGLALSSGQFGVVSRQPGGCSQTTISPLAVSPGTWYHVAGTCDGTNASLYVNGVWQASAPVQPGYVGDGADVRIGASVCCGEYFAGLVDEVSFYNRALSPIEIATIYAAGSNGKSENFPRVAGFTPNDNTTQVPTNTVLTATFTKPMAAATLNGSAFELFDVNNHPVSGLVAYNAATLTAAFTPNPGLTPGGFFSAVITTNATATNGSALVGNIAWNFGTAGNTAVLLSNTTIDETVTNYDGQNLLIVNAVVTVVSGTHGFKTITVAGSGTLVVNGATLQNATVINTNGGAFIINGSGTLDGVTVNGLLDVGSSYDATVLTVTNGLILNGTALVGNPSNYKRGIINFAGSQTLGGAGTLAFGPANGTWWNNEVQSSLPDTTLTIGAGITVRGQNGVVGSGAGAAVSGPANVELVNLGTISCDVSGGTILINAQPFTNQGLAQGINGGTLALGGAWNNAGILVESQGAISLGGDFIRANVGTLNRTNGTIYLSGTLTNTGLTLTLDANQPNSVWVLDGGTILGGTVQTLNGSSLAVAGGSGTLNGVTLNGTLDVGNTYNDVLVLVTNGLVLDGTILVGNPTNDDYGALDFAGTQTLDGSGTVVFGNNENLYNSLLLAEGGTTLTIGPGITVEGQNGTLGYNASYGGPQNVSVVNQGQISANVGGGTLEINAQPFSNAGTLNVGVGGVTAFGQINFGDEVAFAGALNLTLNNGYQPAPGDSLAVINYGYGSEDGTFASYKLPAAGLSWQVSYGETSLTLTATTQLVPVVNLISPTNNSCFQEPVNITLNATATTQNGTIANVAFYQGPNLLGASQTSPFSITWSNVPPGAFMITAVATDTTGAVGASSARNLIVLPAVAGTNFTWTGNDSSDWFDPGNWNPAGVPGAFDEANLFNGRTISLSANVLIGYLNQANGTINGGGVLTISNFYYWTGGVVSSPLTIATNGTLIVAGGGINDLPSTVLTNYGTVAWVNGTLRGGGNGTTLYNYGLWDAQSDQTFNDAYNYNPVTFNNYGTFRKSGGSAAGQTVFGNGWAGVVFNQLAGVVDVQSGDQGLNLVLQGGGSFTGGCVTTNRAGLTWLSVGNFNLNGTITSTNVIENAGNLVGANVITGALTWQAGVWNGAASVTIAPNSTLVVAGGGGNNDLANTVVTNFGTVAWVSGTIQGGGGGGTTLINYGLWDAQSDQTFNDAYNYTPVVFNNYGTFRKSGGNAAGQTVFGNGWAGVVFNQLAGVVDVQNGTNGLNLVLQGGGNFTGGYVTTNSAGLTWLSIGGFNLNGTVTPPNLIENAGNLVGANVINGALTWQAGNWNSAASVTIATNSTLVVAGGGGNNDLANTVVTNFGTVAWVSGTIQGGGGGGTTLINYGLWDAQSDQTFNDAYNYTPVVFNNYGTFRKSGGNAAGQTVFGNGWSGVVFNQLAGVVDVQNGTNGLNLVLQGGGNFTGGYLTTNTGGVTVFSVGGFNLNGTVTSTNLIENAGNLIGANVINGALTWQAGNWNSAASVTIATNSTLVVAGGGGNNDLANTVVTNFGTVAWVSGTLRGGYNGTTLYNYGLWDAQSDQTLNDSYNYNPVVFNNYGTFRKSGGNNAGQTVFGNGWAGVVFNQLAGVVDVQNGTNGLNLVLQGGGNFTGGYITTNTGGVTVFSLGNFNLNGTVTPTNLIENSANLVGVNVINGSLTWQGGVWNGAASVTIAANSTLIVAGGAGVNDLADTVVTNFGTVAWETGTIRGGYNGTTLFNYGLWDAQSDQTLDAGNNYNPVVFNNYGTLRKSGGGSGGQTVFSGGWAGVVFNQLAGVVEVDRGTLSLAGNNTLNTGTLSFGISGPANYGQLNIAGGLSLGGGLKASLYNGYVPAVSNSFTLITCGSESGVFASATLPVNGDFWQVEYTNTAVTLVLADNLTQLVSIAHLRSLLSPNTFTPTDTNTLFTTEGVVTTWTNLTSSANTEFYIQDATAGIAVYWAGAADNPPPAGSLVQVTAPLGEFNGLLALAPVATNFQEGVTILGSTNLPAPQSLPFATNLTGNPALMVQQLQGSYFVASNVFLDLSTPTFAAGTSEPLTNGFGLTNLISFYNPTNAEGGTNYQVSVTNRAGQTFTIYYNPYTDIAGQPKLAGPFNIYGVLGQSAANPPYTNGCEFIPTRFADLVPVAPPTITWTNPAPVSYGTALSASQLEATATFAGTNVPGSFAYSPALGTVLNAGTNQLTVTFTPAKLELFNSATGSVSLMVAPVPLAVAANSATRTYGATNPVFTGTFTGVVNGDAITPAFTTTAGPGSAVGAYPITAGLLDPDGRLVNYTVTATNGLLTVTPAPLTVTANNAARLYGQPNPVFTGTLVGVVNGDDLTATNSSSATAASPVGTYPIIPTLLDPNGLLGNYTVTAHDGTLTVYSNILAISWSAPAAIGYGTALNAGQLDVSVNIPGTVTYTPAAGAVLNAGTNTLKAVFTPTDSVNFPTTNLSVNLVVLPAPLTVTASNCARPYGQTNPILGGVLLGVTNNDDITATYATTATNDSPVGAYPILPTLVDTNNRLANYTVTTNDGVLTVNGLSPQLTWTAPSAIVYGTALGGAQLDAAAGVPGSLAYTPATGAVLNAGTNTLTVVFTPTATNIYLSATDTVSQVVTPAPLTDVANNATRAYGQNNPFFTGTLTGVVNDDGIIAVYSSSAVSLSPPGQYPIVPTLLDPLLRLGNYRVSSTNGTLTVTPIGPQILVEPANALAFLGYDATFNVGVLGTPPLSYQWWFNQTNLVNGATNTTLVITNVDASLTGLYSVIISNAWGSATSAVASLTISNVPDLAVTGVGEPATGQAGQTIQLIYGITNAGAGAAGAPWNNQILLANDAAGDGAQVLGTITFTNSLPAGAGLMATQTVLLPDRVGSLFLGVTVNSGNTVFELNTNNNTAFAASPVVISAPDLVLAHLSAPASAQFGQAFTVTFTVTNAGGAPTAGAWNDQLFIGASASSLTGATTLATLAGTSPLAAGGGYTRTQSVTIPLTTAAAPGTFYLTALADAGNALFEVSTTNNALRLPIALTLPPLPDLTVGRVVSPVTATAGQVIPVSWSVTNAGASTATGPWRDSVYLAPASLTLAQFTANPSASALIGTFTDTNVLAAGTGATFAESVTVPTTGLAGDLRVVVIVNSDNSLIEQTTANNTALALNDLEEPETLSLSLTVTNVVKNTPTPNINSLLTRNGDLTDAVTVTLATSATNNLLVPASLAFPAGVASVPFTAVVLDDGQPGTNVPVTLTASADNYLDATARVLIVNTDLPGLGLTLAASPITEGQTVAATLTSTTVSRQPVVVTLASSSPTALQVPTQVTIPANTNSAGFTVQAVQNNLIAPAQTYTVSASASGYTGASTSLTVLNNNAPTLTLALDRTNLNEADGPLAAVATVTRQPVTSQTVTVSLGSTNPGAAVVPAQVTIPPLQASATFYVSAVNNPNATGPELTLITAQTLDNAGDLVGAAATENLAVQDNHGPVLHLTLTYKVVPKGAAPATVAAVWTTTPPARDLVVTLDSSDTNEAIAPATVILPAGQTNVSFAVSSVDDGFTATSQTVCFTASATNYASGSDVLTVTDIGQPELVVQNLTAPGAAYNGESMTISFKLVNEGLGTLTNPVVQHIYLTANPQSGNNQLLGVVAFAGTLAFGESDTETVVVPASAMPAPGTYWLVVVADVNNAAPELNQAYNTTVSAQPVVVAPAYSAVVQAGVTNVMKGTPVPLSGSATMTVGGPATNVPVNLLVTVRGLQRVIWVYTDANGNFNTVFTPLANEAGAYTVSAVPPGVTSAPAQTQFNILGLALNPPSLTLGVTAGSSVAASVSVQNLSDAPLTGLTTTVNGLAANLNVSANLGADELDGLGTVTLTLNLSAADVSVPQSAFTVHLTSAEGVALDLPVAVTVNPLTPQLVVVPSQLSDSMLVGGQTLVQFDVVNVGGAATGPLMVSLPSVPWMSLATVNPLPSLAPGQTNQVTLVLTPGTNLALGPYAGNLAVNGNGVGVQLPFTFDAVSDAHGSLLVQAVDEYTFFAAGAPTLTNASVTLTDPFSGAVVASGVTDTNGLFFAPGLLAGTYNLALTANQHTPFNGSARVSAGQTNTLQAFLSLQTVSYTWSVVPTQIQDQTEITIQATFQTDVPAPVVVPSPTTIDLSSLTTPGQYLDIPLTLANYGLISVSNVTLSFNSSPLYEFDVVTTDIGFLPAHGTVTVPLRITLLANGVTTTSAAAVASAPAFAGQPNSTTVVAGTTGSCGISMAWKYSYPCGPVGVTSGVQVAVVNYQTDCPPGNGGSTSVSGQGGTTTMVGGGGGGGGGSSGSSGGISYTPPAYVPITVCDCSTLPLPCGSGSLSFNLAGMASKMVASLTAMLPNFSVKSVSLGTTVSGQVCVCCQNDQYGLSSTAQGSVNINVVLTAGPSFAAELPFQASGNWATPTVKLDALLGVQVTVSGSIAATLTQPCMGSPQICLSGSAGLTVFAGAQISGTVSATDPTSGIAYAGSVGGQLGLQGSGTVTVQGCLNSGITMKCCGNITAVANLSGSVSATKPVGTNSIGVQNSISLNANQVLCQAGNCGGGSALITPLDAGPDDTLTNTASGPIVTNLLAEDILTSQADLLTALGMDTAPKVGVCAQIKLQLNQSAVLTENAFLATFQLGNQGASPLTNISVNLAVQNQAGQDVTSLFGLLPPTLSGGMTAVDGTGALAAGGTGTAQWTLIPGLAAAPQVPTNYLVSGTFSYTQNGVVVTIPLAAEPINVQPSPQLYLKYFLQRDVYGDDPFTPEIEPSIPFPLAIMVQNKGYGTAYNFHITSSQPQIVDNAKGLLIDFKIIGTEVDGQPVSPSLTVNFGDVAPDSVEIGQWWLTSSLEGLFTACSATFQNADSQGNLQISPIQGVEIHEITHMVRADGAWDDGRPDFLAIDTNDVHSLPNLLYLSDGTVQPVSVVQTGTNDGPPTLEAPAVQFTAIFPAGFTYVLVPDPSNGQFPIQSVLYADGTGFLTNNFWITDRTFIGQGHPPLLQTNLHLFVYHTNAGPDTLTLVYGPPTILIETNPPESAVFSLAAVSPQTFGVVWSGANFVGGAPVAYYDIYVSDNGGPFTDWQPQTTGTGALFNGVAGHTYAFYSVATDTAGHREATPVEPQAQTTVLLNTVPPTITLASTVTLTAGQTLALGVIASPGNPENMLTFTLGAGAPAGVVVNPASGQITWATSPAFAGTTNVISVIATDNGQPPLSATGTVAVIVSPVVQRTNTPPSLPAIANRTVSVGSSLVITNQAADTNIPAVTLTYTLLNAPAGAGINPTNGRITWTPAPRQGGTTNLFTEAVTDNGAPPLSAYQSFVVTVPDYLSLSLGGTALLSGHNGAVPLTLLSTEPITNLVFTLQYPQNVLTNWALTNAVAQLATGRVAQLSATQSLVSLASLTGQTYAGTSAVAQLSFTTIANPHSQIVPLQIANAIATTAQGQTVTNINVQTQPLVLIGAEPLLQGGLATNGARLLTLYGKPGSSYMVEWSTNLAKGWQAGWRTPLTNVAQGYAGVGTDGPDEFYRAYEFFANPPILMPALVTPTNLTLLVYGLKGSNYVVTVATNLAKPNNWTPAASFTLTNSYQYLNPGAPTNPAGFFRVERP